MSCFIALGFPAERRTAVPRSVAQASAVELAEHDFREAIDSPEG